MVYASATDAASKVAPASEKTTAARKDVDRPPRLWHEWVIIEVNRETPHGDLASASTG